MSEKQISNPVCIILKVNFNAFRTSLFYTVLYNIIFEYVPTIYLKKSLTKNIKENNK